MIDPYTGPAILMEEAAGVFFHEASATASRASGRTTTRRARTFKGQIGKPILPDVPHRSSTIRRCARSATTSLNGYYRFDDEGVAARPVTLVDNGVLRDYLKSRTPVNGVAASNGHGRAEGTLRSDRPHGATPSSRSTSACRTPSSRRCCSTRSAARASPSA